MIFFSPVVTNRKVYIQVNKIFLDMAKGNTVGFRTNKTEVYGNLEEGCYYGFNDPGGFIVIGKIGKVRDGTIILSEISDYVPTNKGEELQLIERIKRYPSNLIGIEGPFKQKEVNQFFLRAPPYLKHWGKYRAVETDKGVVYGRIDKVYRDKLLFKFYPY